MHARVHQVFGIEAARPWVEVLNDVNRDLSDLYRVVRCPRRAYDLEVRLSLTPFSRAEHDAAYLVDPDDDRVEVARKAIVRGAMAFGTGTDGGVLGRRAGFRDTTSPLGRTTLPVDDWYGYADALAGMTARLRGVIVDCRDAVDVMRRHEREDTLHYVDPPYVHATRGKDLRGYVHELDDAEHFRLLECLVALRGPVVLSGYWCALYDDALAGWKRVEREFVDQGRRARVEACGCRRRRSNGRRRGRYSKVRSRSDPHVHVGP